MTKKLGARQQDKMKEVQRHLDEVAAAVGPNAHKGGSYMRWVIAAAIFCVLGMLANSMYKQSLKSRLL